MRKKRKKEERGQRLEESEVRGRENVERMQNKEREKQWERDDIYDTIPCLIIHKTAITSFYKNISFK